jgi:hypothetical protein
MNEDLIRREDALKAMHSHDWQKTYDTISTLPAVKPEHRLIVAAREALEMIPGLFHLTGDTLGLRCATTGCGQHVSTRFESDGVGSDYCEPCGRKAAEPKDKSNAF